MSTVRNLAFNLRPVSVNDLRMELRALQAGEALMLSVGGREYIVICDQDWSRMVEDAGDQLLQLAPNRFENP